MCKGKLLTNLEAELRKSSPNTALGVKVASSFHFPSLSTYSGR